MPKALNVGLLYFRFTGTSDLTSDSSDQKLILFDDDIYITEAVKATNVQKCNFSQSRTLFFKIFWGTIPLDPPRRPKKFFLAAALLENFLGLTSPQNKKS